LNIEEKIRKARMFSRILREEKYETPHNKIKNAQYIKDTSIFEGRLPKSNENTPQLPIINIKRNLRSSSPSKIKQMNKYKEKIEKKSIFFPKINKENEMKIVDLNEFLEEKTSDISFIKKIKGLEKFQCKVINKFPKDFFPQFE